MSRDVEIGWTVGTLFLALFIAWFTASSDLGSLVGHAQGHRDPCRRQAVDVEDAASQRRARDQRTACADRRAGQLVMTSQDVIHSFFVPAVPHQAGRASRPLYADMVPGHEARHVSSVLHAALRHGARAHGRRRRGHDPGDYARWSAAQPRSRRIAREGEALFRSLGCSGCHARIERPRAAARRPLRQTGASVGWANRGGGRRLHPQFDPAACPRHRGRLRQHHAEHCRAWSATTKSSRSPPTSARCAPRRGQPDDRRSQPAGRSAAPTTFDEEHTLASWLFTTDHKRIAHPLRHHDHRSSS